MKKNILLVSSLCSEKIFNLIFNTSFQKPGQAIQKFLALLAEGLAEQKENHIETLTSIPVTANVNKKVLWNLRSENFNNIYFNYIPTINLPFIKNIIDIIYSFIKVLFWKFSDQYACKIIVCDTLRLSISAGAFCAAKIRGIKIVAIVTDMPGLDVFEFNILHTAKNKLIYHFITKYDGYILITRHMNNVINPYKKPHLIMEGLVDSSMVSVSNKLADKSEERILVYAGGIYERYGIKNLIEAFMQLDDDDIRLYIYGNGPMADEMPAFISLDQRIKYMGVVPNHIVVDTQLKATLLINPRPSFEEYAKFSFPSKNMEYMVSGTPVVTTLLPGMPEEYIPYVYLFEDESVQGIYLVLKSLLNKPREELHNFGTKAKEFVLTNKNNFLQSSRATVFFSEVLKN